VLQLLQSHAVLTVLRIPLLASSPFQNFQLFTGILRGPRVWGKATYISLVGDIVKRARDSDCEEDREPGSTRGPLEVLVAVHLHLCGRS
jgi:hypothetical protein